MALPFIDPTQPAPTTGFTDPTQPAPNTGFVDPTQPTAQPNQGMQPRAAVTSSYDQGGSANSFERGLNSGIGGIGVGLQRLKGLGQALIGNRDDAIKTLTDAKASEDQLAAQGPQVSSYKDVHSLGDAGSYAAGLVGEAIPTLATMLLPGGAGGKLAAKAAEKGATSLAAGFAEKVAASEGAGALEKATAKIAGDAAKTVADRAHIAGEFAGSTLGGLPSTAGTTDLTPEQLADHPAKAALGTIAASAAGAVPAARLLERAGAGAEAGVEVAKKSGSFIPGVVKEAAAQGVTASVAGAAQTAATLATHKWIDGNSDMMSPAAFDQYLNSVIGGGVIGGLTGGLLGAAKGAKAPDLSGIKNPFEKFGAEVDAPKDGVPPQGDASRAQPSAATTESPAAEESSDPFHAAASQFQSAAGDIDNPAAKTAFQRGFKFNVDNPEGAVHEAYTHAMDAVRGDADAESSLRGMMSKFFSSKAAETIDLKDEPAERFDEHLGAINDDDRSQQVVADATKAHQDFQAGADPIGGAAPRATNPVKFDSPIENTIASFIPTDHPLWGVPDETKGVVKSVSKMFTGDDITPKDRANIDLMGKVVGDDTIDKWKEAGPKYAELSKLADKVGDAAPDATSTARPLADMSHSDLQAGLANADVGSDEHTVLQHEYRSRLADSSALLTENRSTAKSRAFFEGKADSSNTVEVTSEVGGRRQLVDLNTLVSKRLAGEGKSTGETPHQALASVLGDLKMGGVEVKSESVKPGTFYRSKSGDEAKLSPRQAAEIRGELAKVEMTPQAKAAGKEKAVREAVRRAQPKEEAPVDKVEERANARDKPEESFDQKAVEGDVTEKREPGKSPPGDLGGGIAEVSLHDPHEATIRQARKDFRDAKTPAERAKIQHEAGVTIGAHEIKQEGLSERNEAVKLKRLNDPETGLAQKFLDTASKTDKYVRAHVQETKSEDRTPADNARQKADANEAVRAAYQKTQDKPSRFTRNADVEAAIREAGDSKTRTPAQDRLLKTARQAADVLGEDHPFSRAAADTTPDSTVREHLAERSDVDLGDVHDEKPGKHQYGKETKMVNAILDRVGFKGPRLTVRAAPEGMKGGKWNRAENTIYVSDHLTGPERVEVIAHEVGHHLVHHELGDALQKATPEVRDALNKDYQAWVKKQFESGKTYGEIRASRAPYFRGEAVKAKEGNARTLGEIDPQHTEYLLDQHEWLADNISRALTQKKESVGIIGKFFSGIAAKLSKLYDSMFSAGNEKYAPEKSVDKWVQSLFDRNTNDVNEALGTSVPRETAEVYTKAAVHETAPDPVVGKGESILDTPHFQAWSDMIDKLSPEQRGMIERLAYRRPITTQIREYFKDDAKMLKALEEPEKEIQALSYAVNKMLNDKTLDLSARWNPKHGFEPIMDIRDRLLRVAGLAGSNDLALRTLADLNSGEVAKTMAAGNKYDVRERVGKEKGEAQQTLNLATQIARTAIYEPYRRFLYGPSSNAHLSYTPALRWVQSQMKAATGAIAERHGYTQDVMRMRTQFHRQTAQALAGLDKDQLKDALNALQTNTTPADATTRQGVQSLRRVFGQAFDYAKEAGVPLNKRDNYFPVVPDKADIANREGDFKKFFSDPKWKESMLGLFGDTTQEEAVNKLFKYATGNEHEAQNDPSAPPAMREMNPRLWSFVYHEGTPEDIKTLAGFQAKSFDDIAPQYFEHLTKRAEYARRFGDDGAKLDKALEKAKRQNASDKDIQYMRDVVASHTGAYGADGSPLVRTILGDKAAKIFADPTTKSGMNVAMAYQNIRTLPLALMSALADPMGIGVRYGGIKDMKDLNQAFKSLKDGFAAMKGNRKDLVDQASIINMADDYMTQEILSDGMSPGLEGLSRKVSDKMFKWNGLSWYVRSTRFMALSAANAFLLKHGAGLDAKNSTRYLNELGVKASDIEAGPNGTVKTNSGDAERDTRVQSALARFVDEAILRTDASQHPRWMNDPAARMVAQYKQFGYAFADQIIDRITHEMHFNNFATLGPALGYVPITIMAEMTRGLIQYGPGGNPNRDDWGWDQYATMGLYRSGLLGPQLEFAQGIGVLPKAYAGMQHMDIGPTGQQLGDVMKTLEGQRSIGSTVLESLPASSLYKHW